MLNTPEGEGEHRATRRAHLSALADRGHEHAIEKLTPPPISAVAVSMLTMFREITRVRLPTGFGVAPIQYEQINGWEQRRGIRISVWMEDLFFDLDLIERSDGEYQPHYGGDV